MSDWLKGTLTALADEASLTPELPVDPWQVGRRERRRSRIVTAAALVVFVVVAASLVPAWLGGGAGIGLGPAAPGDAVPGRIYKPWLWQDTVDESLPGRASVIFYATTPTPVRLESGDRLERMAVVVGRNGDYRMLDYRFPSSPFDYPNTWLLSSDGRYVARPGGPRGGLMLLDLTTGNKRQFDGTRSIGGGYVGIVPLAWSRDGGRLLAMRSNDDPVEAFDSTGKQINETNQPDDVVVIDAESGELRVLMRAHTNVKVAGSFSPDGHRVAVTVAVDAKGSDQLLKVIDLADSAVRWTTAVPAGRWLLGDRAWTPDGRRLAVLTRDGCGGPCLEYLDADTGTAVGRPVPLRAELLPDDYADEPPSVRLLGWRGGVEPVTVLHDRNRHPRFVAIRGDGSEEVLLDAADGVEDVQVARDLVEEGRFGGPSPRPSPMDTESFFHALFGAMVTAGLLAFVRVAWAIRRRATRRRIRLRPAPTPKA